MMLLKRRLCCIDCAEQAESSLADPHTYLVRLRSPDDEEGAITIRYQCSACGALWVCQQDETAARWEQQPERRRLYPPRPADPVGHHH